MKVQSIISILIYNLLILIVLVLLVEIIFRVSFETHSDQKSFRLTQPPPYQNAPYFSVDFINESFTQGGWDISPDTKLIYPNNYTGKYFTVENNRRRTTDVPVNACGKIFLFGGSTVYNAAVPDDYTIASFLQRKLVENGQINYQVVNSGVTSVNTLQQLERLKITNISPEDIIIFYDGVNDVVQGVLYGNPGSTIVGSDKSRPWWHKLFSKIANHSVIIRKALSNMASNYKIHNLESRVIKTVTRYEENINAAEIIVREKGASFIHFLQPNLYTLARLGEYETTLLTLEIIPVQAEGAFIATYPHLEEIVEKRSNKGYADYNLVSALDNLDSPVYLDFCHVTHVATETIADTIASTLIELDMLNKTCKNKTIDNDSDTYDG